MRTKPLALLAAAATAVSLFVAAPADAAPARPAAHVVTAAKAASTLKLKRTSTATPVAADWITLTGTASKALAGAKLTVQRKESGKGWGPVGTTKVFKAGTFAIRTRATGVGDFSYKVSSAKTKKLVAVTSNTVDVTVFAWYFLADLRYVSSDNGDGSDSVVMAGRTYYKSKTMTGSNGRTHFLDYNASYKCTRFFATVGVSDGSASGVSINHTLLAESTPIAAETTTVGATRPIDADITGVFRVRLQDEFAVPASSSPYYGTAGWGDARMLCSGQP